MKILIAVLGCGAHRAYYDALRATCYAGDTLHRFFQGAPAENDDEVELEVADGYLHLPFKTQRVCEWAIRREFDFMFKADTDTFVDVRRLMASGFEKHCYSGYHRGDSPSYASGGSGYWLDRQAMKIVARAAMREDWSVDDRPSVIGEDLQVGRVLLENGIVCFNDSRYRLFWPGPQRTNEVISIHNTYKEPVEPWLFKMHAQRSA
jgi:hypothetical protein